MLMLHALSFALVIDPTRVVRLRDSQYDRGEFPFLPNRAISPAQYELKGLYTIFISGDGLREQESVLYIILSLPQYLSTCSEHMHSRLTAKEDPSMTRPLLDVRAWKSSNVHELRPP